MLIELQSPFDRLRRAAGAGGGRRPGWEAGVTTLALTDHDAVAGVEEAAEAAEGLGIELVPAIEMSCVHEYAEDLHICGYWVDLGDDRRRPANAPRRNGSTGPRRSSRGCADEGFDVHARGRRSTRPATRSRSAARTSPGPPAPAATSARSSRSTWSPAPRPSSRAAGRPPSRRSRLIHEAGGVAVIAHPYWDIDDPDEVEDLIRSLELDGVEAFYPPHTQEQTEHLLRALRRAGPDPHRLLRLPRPDPQDLHQVRRLRHLRLRRAAGSAEAAVESLESLPPVRLLHGRE